MSFPVPHKLDEPVMGVYRHADAYIQYVAQNICVCARKSAI